MPTKKSTSPAFVEPTIVATTGPGMLHCNNCNHDNDPALSQCENCGVNLFGPALAHGPANAPFNLRNFLRKPVVVMGIVMVVLLCVGVAYWNFVASPANAETTSVPEGETVAESPANVESINVMPGEEIPLDCGLTVTVPDDLDKTTEQTFHNPANGCSTTVRWVIP